MIQNLSGGRKSIPDTKPQTKNNRKTFTSFVTLSDCPQRSFRPACKVYEYFWKLGRAGGEGSSGVICKAACRKTSLLTWDTPNFIGPYLLLDVGKHHLKLVKSLEKRDY